MFGWRAAVLAAALTLVGAPVLAQTGDDAEIAFWNSVAQDDVAGSYQAYLDTYPNGTFAALARLRLSRGHVPIAGPVGVPAGVPAGVPVGVPAPVASVRPAAAEAALVDGVVVDVDAERLRNGSNWRLAAVPAGTPEGPPADMAAFLENSVGAAATRLHLTVPAMVAGRSEVRLYWIPDTSDAYVVAARAAVTIRPGVAGAALMRTVAREAARLGPVRFEAAHRDRPMLIQAAFLRVLPSSEWNYAWFSGVLHEIARPTLVLRIGQPGAVPDRYGSLGEGVCLLAAGGAALDRVAGLRNGDPILVRAVPTSWSNAGADSPILLDACEWVR